MQVLLDAQKAGALKFKLFSKMDLGTRIVIVIGALVLGLLLQLFIVWWLGLPLVVFGVLMSLCDGATNKPRRSYFGKWENVTVEEFRRVLEMLDKSARWSRDPFGLSPKQPFIGLGVLVLLAGVLLAVGYQIYAAGAWNTFLTFTADGGVMLLLLYITGLRYAWEPPGLRIKLEPLLNVCGHFDSYPDPAIEIVPMLELKGKGKKQVPSDCKLMLKLKGAPEDFYGVQVQTSLNDVQGTKYPYMYCVLLAKSGSGLVEKVEPFLTKATEKLGFFASANDKKNKDLRKKRYRREVAEPKKQLDVELVVIRQVTLGRGYYTKKKDQIRVVETAVDLARKVYGL